MLKNDDEDDENIVEVDDELDFDKACSQEDDDDDDYVNNYNHDDDDDVEYGQARSQFNKNYIKFSDVYVNKLENGAQALENFR